MRVNHSVDIDMFVWSPTYTDTIEYLFNCRHSFGEFVVEELL